MVPIEWISFELNRDSDVDLGVYDTVRCQIQHLDLGFQEAAAYSQRDFAIYMGRADATLRTGGQWYILLYAEDSRLCVYAEGGSDPVLVSLFLYFD